MKKVLVLATSRKTKGGITSVLKIYNRTKFWQDYKFLWIETHIDKNIVVKIYYFLKALVLFLEFLSKFQIVYIHLSEPASAIRKCIFLIIAKVLNKKIIIHFHSFSIDSTLKSRINIVYKFIFRNSDLVIVLSNYWRNECIKFFPNQNKFKVVLNPCEKHDTVFVEKEKIVLFAGQLVKRKGYYDLISAFSLIVDDFPDWRLCFAGDGEIEEARELASRKGIDLKVDFVGWVSDMVKESYFRKCSIFCVPSYAEGFSMSLLDACSYGLPIICTKLDPLTEFFEDKKNCLYFNNGDVNQLAINLRLLMSDSNLRTSISIGSLELAHKIFSTEKMAKQMEIILDEISNF